MQVTHRRSAALAVSLMIAVSASCSSDSTSETSAAATSASAGDDRQTIIEQTVSAASDGGIVLERDCVAGVVEQLSDEDVAILAPSLVEGGEDADLSDEGEALGETLLDCVVGSDDQTLIDRVIDKVITEGNGDIDEECIRTSVPRLNDDQLQLLLQSPTGSTGPESTDPQLQNVAFLLRDCLDLNSTDTTG